MKSYYNMPGVRETCHAVKQVADMQAHNDAVKTIAQALVDMNLVTDKDYLIPAPQHTGKAEYTKEIATAVSELTGATVLDVLHCKPHVPLYDQKKRGIPFDLRLYIKGNIPSTGKLFFVDNVAATWSTFKQANKLFNGKLNPLIYAVDDTFIQTAAGKA